MGNAERGMRIAEYGLAMSSSLLSARDFCGLARIRYNAVRRGVREI